MRKKHTREQLEFYFIKLMHKIGRIPTEEDMAKAKGYPSASSYAERFGSWSAIKKKLGKKELNRKKCAQCGKEIGFKKKNKMFCSASCSKKASTIEKYKKIPPKKCSICGKDYHILDTPNFKKRKICLRPECKSKWSIVQNVKKYNKLTYGTKKTLQGYKNNKCKFCTFNQILYFITPGKYSEKKLVNMIKRKDFSYFLVCPNHQALIKAKKLKIG